jgi:hypothetical protein
MADIDLRSAWVCGLWCGVSQWLICERLAADHERGPYTERAKKADASCIRKVMVGHPYLEEPAREALALLGGAP